VSLGATIALPTQGRDARAFATNTMPTNRKPSTGIRLLLAENLIRLRKARGLTQMQLGAATGITTAYISKVERACMNISLANIEALTVGLDCSPIDFFSRVNCPPHPPLAKHESAVRAEAVIRKDVT
jgi:DNA-binding Xre family transcriptional regulator